MPEDETSSIAALLTALGVERTVAVDDEYGEQAHVADVFVAIQDVPPNQISELAPELNDLNMVDHEIQEQQLGRLWPTIEMGRRRAILQALRAATSPEEARDLKASKKLGETFGGREFLTLGRVGWLKRKEEILEAKPRLLLMIDEDLHKDGGRTTEGLDLIGEVMQRTDAESVTCVLLSHKYSRADDLLKKTEEICVERRFDRGRFVLIPKDYLDGDSGGFVQLLKLAMIAKPINQLRELATKVLNDALKEAVAKTAMIGLLDMDELVFRSSWREGVWEPETLLRVFSLYHKVQTRKLALQNSEMHELARQMRRVSLIPANPIKQLNHNIWPIQHSEIYDEEDYVNSLHFPLDLGDIFEKKGGQKFILIAPPCDLMVRSTGMRSDGIEYATLAPILEPPAAPTTIQAANPDERSRNPDNWPESGVDWELPYFDEADSYFVKFRMAINVRLFGLDLCVLNPDGKLTLSVDAKPNLLLIPSWAKRFDRLLSYVRKIIEDYRRSGPPKIQVEDEGTITEAQKHQQKAGRATQALILAERARLDSGRTFTPTVQTGPDRLSYNLKRVARLTQPRASALLAAYARFLTRPAFDHDLLQQKNS